jgi:hypothetical protein
MSIEYPLAMTINGNFSLCSFNVGLCAIINSSGFYHYCGNATYCEKLGHFSKQKGD